MQHLIKYYHFITLATIIVVAHSFVPHTHEGQYLNHLHIQSEEHDEEPKIWKLAEELFSLDIGAEHLEHIALKDFSLDAVIHTNTTFFKKNNTRTSSIKENIHFYKNTSLYTLSLRGPPIC